MAPYSKDRGIDEAYEKANLKGDRLNFVLLTLLYQLQGTIIGVAIATPSIIQKRGVTYEDQGEFSFIWLPSMTKIVWAPIVDSIYFKKVGRRKTWLGITQLCAGMFLFFLSLNTENWLGTEDGQRRPNVRLLAVFFFTCILSVSIADIAVDGWSLTLLQKRNVAYAAVCQGVGAMFGVQVMSASFIILESKDFSNVIRSVFGSAPQNHGLVSFSQYFFYLSLLIVISTVLIVLFKKEERSGRAYSTKLEDDNEYRLSMRESYALVWKILKKSPVQILALVLITRNIGVGPVQNVATLKLLDSGVSRDTLATIGLLMFPVQLITAVVLNRCLTGRRQLSLFLVVYVFRLIHSYVYAAFIFILSYWKQEYHVLPAWYYWPLLVIHSLQNILFSVTMVTLTAFFARISDPKFGGVYLTLFNSMMNAGEICISSVCLWSVNLLNITSCSVDETNGGKVCRTVVDGFYVQLVVFSLVGLVWLFWARRTINFLEMVDVSAFRVKQNPANKELTVFSEGPLHLLNKDDEVSKTDAIENRHL